MTRDNASKKEGGRTLKLKAVPNHAGPRRSGAADVDAPETTVVTSAAAVVADATVKKPDFLDRATKRSGVKRRDAKPAIEAALMELAETLLRGEELNLPPLGKLKVQKSKDLAKGAKALTLKLRTMKDGAGVGKTGVAEEIGEG